MKISVKILVLLLFTLYSRAADLSLLHVRNLYYKASANKADAEAFSKVMQTASGISRPLVEAYQGMALMIKAKFAVNPYYKLSYFVKGRDQLDNAIKTDAENAELRFLRYCVQTNAPGFLGYSSKITEDKAVLKRLYPTLRDADLKSRIKLFMCTSSDCSKEEKLIFI